MRAENLDHKELLELDPEGGLIRFAGQRALLIDAVAMGLLRKYLVENFGTTAARTVLTSSASPTAGEWPRRYAPSSRGRATTSGGAPARASTPSRACSASSPAVAGRCPGPDR